MTKLDGRDVHTEHCCTTHGCKYGDPDCTVVTGQKKQSFPCDECMPWDPEYDEEEPEPEDPRLLLREALECIESLLGHAGQAQQFRWETIHVHEALCVKLRRACREG